MYQPKITLKESSLRGVAKVGINDLPQEIHDMIIDRVVEGDDRYSPNAYTCSLTQRAWRHRGQHHFHRHLLFTPDNCEGFSVYFTVGSSGDVVSTRLAKSPRIVAMCGFPKTPTASSWITDAQRLGSACSNITSLNLDGCDFPGVEELIVLLSKFKSLKRLELRGCSWIKDTVDAEWHHMPTPPLHLEKLVVVCDSTAAALAKWLSLAPESNISTLDWKTHMTLKEDTASTTALLRASGASLTKLLSWVEIEHVMPIVGKQDRLDLSKNTNLSSLWVEVHLQPNCAPSNVLASTISTLNSPALEEVSIYVWAHETRDMDFDHADIATFQHIMLYPGRFPKLKTVTLWLNLVTPNDWQAVESEALAASVDRLRAELSKFNETKITLEVTGELARLEDYTSSDQDDGGDGDDDDELED